MTFYATEIDACPAYGWQGGPSIDVLIKRLVSGREKRKPQSFVRLHSYILPYQNITDRDYLEYIKSAYMALGGPTDSFLVKDYGDFLAIDEPLGVSPAGSTPVQLLRTYSFGSASHSRAITKPVSGAVISQNGIPKAGTLDTLTGLFTPTTAWTAAAVLTWDGEFRVPVRFDQMTLTSTIDNRTGPHYAVNGSVTLIEVYGE
jgi:uncharacterized protein (TIGR02217 family)